MTTIQISSDSAAMWRTWCAKEHVASHELFDRFVAAVKRGKWREFYLSLPDVSKTVKPLTGTCIQKTYKKQRF